MKNKNPQPPPLDLKEALKQIKNTLAGDTPKLRKQYSEGELPKK